MSDHEYERFPREDLRVHLRQKHSYDADYLLGAKIGNLRNEHERIHAETTYQQMIDSDLHVYGIAIVRRVAGGKVERIDPRKVKMEPLESAELVLWVSKGRLEAKNAAIGSASDDSNVTEAEVAGANAATDYWEPLLRDLAYEVGPLARETGRGWESLRRAIEALSEANEGT